MKYKNVFMNNRVIIKIINYKGGYIIILYVINILM